METMQIGMLLILFAEVLSIADFTSRRLIKMPGSALLSPLSPLSAVLQLLLRCSHDDPVRLSRHFNHPSLLRNYIADIAQWLRLTTGSASLNLKHDDVKC